MENIFLGFDPNNFDVHKSLGILNFNLSKWQDSLNSFTKALRINPSDVELSIYLGRIFRHTHNYEKAKQIFKKLLDRDAKNSEAIIELKGEWYPAGDMSQLYFKRELEATAFQFESVKGLKVLVNGKVFDWCVDDMSDGEGGCNEKPQLWVVDKK